MIKDATNNQSNAYPEEKDIIKEGGQIIQGGYYGISTNLGGGPQNYYFTYSGTGAGAVDTDLVLCNSVTPSPSPTRTISLTPSITVSKSITPSVSVTPTPTPTNDLTAISLEYGSVDCATVCANQGSNSSGTFYIDSGAWGTASKLYADIKGTTFAAANFYIDSSGECRSVDGSGNLSAASPCPSITPTPSQTKPSPSATPSITVTPSTTPSVSTTPSITVSPSKTPSKTPPVSPSPSPAVLYNFDGASGTTAGTGGATICGSAISSPVTLKSTTNDGFGNGTLVNGSSVIYNNSNVRQDSKFISDGSVYGQTNSVGVYSSIGVCSI